MRRSRKPSTRERISTRRELLDPAAHAAVFLLQAQEEVHAPARLIIENGPVERRRATIARNAGMHVQTSPISFM